MNRKLYKNFSLLLLFALVLSACGANAPVTVAATPVAVGFTPTSVCLVPNVVGLDLGRAEEILIEVGLQPVKKYQEDPSVAKDALISQEPAADTRLAPCTGDVTMVVSLGEPSIPTETPAPPTLTPTATPFPPTATATLIPSTATATPTQAPFTFSDNFNVRFNPDWRIVEGQPFILDGWLRGGVILETGSSSLSNYVVEFDYKLGDCCGVAIMLSIGEKFRFVLSQGGNSWNVFSNGDWKETITTSNGGGKTGHLKFIVNGNEYKAVIGNNEIGKTVFGDEAIKGALRITLKTDNLFIDNVVIAAP